MAPTHILPLYDKFLDFLVDKVTPEAILAFKASTCASGEAQELIERNSAGTLTPEEKQILAQMTNFERMMSLLKAKALVAIAHQK